MISITRAALLVTAMMTSAPLAVAAEKPCHCEQYRAQVNFGSLAEKISKAGLKLIHGDGKAFDRSTEDQFYHLLFESQHTVPRECFFKFVNEIRGQITIIVQGQSGNNEQQKDASKWAQLFLENYGALYSKIPENCLKRTGIPKRSYMWISPSSVTPFNWTPEMKAAYKKCITEVGPKISQEVDQLLESKSAEELILAVGNGSLGRFHLNSVREAQMVKAFHHLLKSSTSEDDLFKKAARLAPSLSTQEILAMGTTYGALTGGGYDRTRAAKGISAQGAIGGDSILRVAQNNLMYGTIVNTEGAEAYSPAQFAATCRDQAVHGARFFNALGLKSYVAAYQTRGGIPHVSNIVVDPKNKNQLYGVSFGTLGYSKGGDASALVGSGTGDLGLGTYLFNHDGNPIGFIPGKTSAVQAQFAGGSIQDVGGDPLARSSASITAAQTRLSQENEQRLNLGIAKDALGSTHFGVGYQLHHGSGTLFPGKLGTALSLINTPGSHIGSKSDSNVGMLYILAQQEAHTPRLRLGSTGIQASADTKLGIDAQVGEDFSEGGQPIFWGGLHLKVGAEVEKAWEEAAKIKARAETQLSPSVKDIRDPTSPHQLTVTSDYVSVVIDGNIRLSEEQRIYLVTQLTYVRNQLGSRGRAEVGVAANDTVFTVSGEGALTEGTERFQDGARKRIAGNLTVSALDNKVTLTLSPFVEIDEGGRQGVQSKTEVPTTPTGEENENRANYGMWIDLNFKLD